MKLKIFTLFLALLASIGTIFAKQEKIQIGDLYYYLYESVQMAEVTSQSDNPWTDGNYPYLITAKIPASVEYGGKTYNVTSIGSYAFYNCSVLLSIEIPSSIIVIDYTAFYCCTGLTSVTIPNSVTSIEEGAFARCTGLTSITIPSSVTIIGKEAFSGCSGLTSITMQEGVTSIGNYAFNGCTGLTSVTIPNSVTSIEEGAFDRCTGLTSITIPSSVTIIGKEAFYYCTGLTSVTIGKSVTSIGERAFYACPNLTSIVWNAKKCNDFSYNLTPFYTPNGEYDIRTQITSFVFGDDVEYIPACLCYGVSLVNNVIIPSNVTSIGRQAFYGCTGLTSITMQEGVTSIGNHAFGKCDGLKSIEIPNSVTSIGDYAFYGCTGLTSVTIPNSVASIGEQAFYDCTGLTSVQITNLSTWCAIQFKNQFSNPLYYAFNLYLNGNQITDLVIPNDVISIENQAFYNCRKLTSLTIPNSVKSIGHCAFYECWRLTSITCNAVVPPTLGSSVFKNVHTTIPLYVPEGSISDYQTAEQWKDFTNILPITEAIDHIDCNSSQETKILRDGQIFLLRGEKVFSVTGQEVR